MKKSGMKYLGFCATALLTIAPVATNVFALVSQYPTVSSVKAADSNYQNSLDSGFNSNVNVAVDDLKYLSNLGGDYSSGNGNIVYPNAGASNALFGETPATTYDSLKDVVKNELLNLLVNKGAIVGFLSNKNYRTTVKLTGDRLTDPTSADDLANQLRTLTIGDTFKVSLTTRDAAGDIKGSKNINVTLVSSPAKSNLSLVDSLQVKSDSQTSVTENAVDNAKVIRDSSGNRAFTPEDLNNARNKSPYFYQTGRTITSDYPKYKLRGDNSVTVVNQYIPVLYRNSVASKYNANSFKFLTKSSNGNTATITSTPVTPGNDSVAYVVRQVIVGTITDKDYPVFRYSSTDSNGTTTTETIRNGKTLTPNNVDAAKLTYKYNDQDSLNNLESYLKNGFQKPNNGAGNFRSYLNIDKINSTDSSDLSEITFTMPSVKSTDPKQFVIATSTNSATGVQSIVKIPVNVTSIPNAVVAPKITKFPKDNAVSVNNKNTTSFDPKGVVAATYIDGNGAIQNLPAGNIKVTVKDASGKDVPLNSDGTVPIKNNGTLTLHYVFSNPNDDSKTVSQDLTLNVTSDDSETPKVTGFNDNAVYTLSNNDQKEVNPFASVLGMSNVKATYVGADGATHVIENSKVTYWIKNKSGQTVSLNSSGNISMISPDTYTIDYVWTNPDDPTKVTTKSSTLIINSTVSQPISVKYSGDEVANPTIENGTTFNVLNNISFNLTYTDPTTSTPTTPINETVPNKYISISVRKDGQEVPMVNNTFSATAGNYVISYSITNPKNNASIMSYSRTVTVKSMTGATIESAEGVIWINYDWGYGINLWKNYDYNHGFETTSDGTARKMMAGTAWKFSSIATYPDGSKWYKLGTNQWIPGQFASFTEITQPSSDWKITNLVGLGTVNYVPGYGINVWTTPDMKTPIKKLPHGTSWKYFKIAKKGGRIMFNLGGNQWVDGNYFNPQS